MALVGGLSYGCSLLMTHLLGAAEYSSYAAAQSLLGMVGIVAAALTPLPLAHAVRTHPRGSRGRRDGVAFAWTVAAAAGLLSALVTGAIATTFAGSGLALAVGASALALFLIAPIDGLLQGELRFVRFASIKVAEIASRVVFSVAAVLLGWHAGGALVGFAVGAFAVLLIVPRALWRDSAWRPQVLSDRWRWAETGDIALTQLVVSVLIGADVVLVAVLGDGSAAAAGYQALSTLAKASVYVAAGTAVVAFPLLRSAGVDVHDVVRSTLRSFSLLSLSATAVVATVPGDLLGLVLPARYAGSDALLPALAVAGLGYATIALLATVLLGLRAYRRSQLGLLGAALVLPVSMLVGWEADSVRGLALGGALGAVAAAAALWALATPLLPSGSTARLASSLVLAAGLFALLQAARPHLVVWLTAVLVTGCAVLIGMRRGPRSAAAVESAADMPGQRGLRVLHLGFEDPAMPGAGGGSLRTHEVNRRLATRDHVTVLVQRFPGALDRVQDGVSYRHIGIGNGANRLTRLLGYMVCLPAAVRRHEADVVVEDFFAPISSLGAPAWTGRPTLGVVQWLNAEDKARQYKLPFPLVQKWGVRRHRRLVAVSLDVGQQLQALNPDAEVDVIGNAVAPEAFVPRPRLGVDVVFVGRLETEQKGLDLLLHGWAAACTDLGARLLVAGTGPDERRLRDLADELGISSQVDFLGWVSGAEKYELLASARLVAMPSRFETFGLVALEGMATGTPVVAFDLPCLRELLPEGCGHRVPDMTADAYGEALRARYTDLAWLEQARARGRVLAGHYDWDAVADRQRAVYAAVAGAAASTHPDLREAIQ
ncbi:glycosyltransferase [Modestobacter italicus]|uniref:glycosyltransferase n=1 Tax=Modestobacter italicus (strain DSM 44449 / CECT 9708 / BC 501) TaxID=2732864 RepID=UPI0018D31A60|nr:glycosyltransferase [Modestobacter marinus]